MSTVNHVLLVGRLGTEPEFRVLGSDGTKAASKFRMATDRYGRDKPDWHSVTCWGQPGLFARDHLGKGDLVCVQGRIEYSQDGKGRWHTDIVAHRVELLVGKKREAAEPDPPSEPQTAGTAPEDDLPFAPLRLTEPF